MTDPLDRLQQLSFNGIILPCTSREFGFSHDQISHRYIYRNEQIIESLGRQNPTYSYEIPFRDGINIKNYSNLFSKSYPLFLKECQKDVRGVLIDPIHGKVYVKCTSLSENLQAGLRDGVDVRVSFVKSPNENELANDEPALISINGVSEEIRKFDAEITAATIEVPEGFVHSGLDPFGAISSVLDQVDAIGNKVLATFDNTLDRIKRLEYSIEKAKDPKFNQVRARARALKAQIYKIPDVLEITGNRPIDNYKVEAAMDLVSLSGKLNNTTQELTRLNGQIARNPMVAVGTIVRYYRTIDPVQSFIRGTRPQ